MVGAIVFSDAEWEELERLARLGIGADARRAVADAVLDFLLKLSREQSMPSVKTLQRRLEKMSAATMQLRAGLLGDATPEVGSVEWHVATLVLNGYINSTGDVRVHSVPESWSRALQEIGTALEWAGNRLKQEAMTVPSGPQGGRELDGLLKALAQEYKACGGKVTLGTRRPSQGGEYRGSRFGDFVHRVIEMAAAKVEGKRRRTTLTLPRIKPPTRAAIGERVFRLKMTRGTVGGGK